MKTTGFIFAALLGLGASTAAFAQTVPGTPGAIATPGVPGGVVTGQPGTTVGTVPNSTVPGTLTTPAGTAAPAGTMPGTVYSPGATTAPNATLNTPQPIGTSPITPSATRGATTGGRNTTTKTIRP